MSTLRDKLVFYLILIFTFSFVLNTSKNMIRFFGLQKDYNQKREEMIKLLEHNQELREQLISMDNQAIEALVRDKLSMAKPGETIIILPEELSRVQEKIEESKQNIDIKNWQKWVKIFTKEEMYEK